MHLARALKSAGQPGRSAEVYSSVLQLQPHHPTAHYKLGSVLRHMGKHEAAAEAYRCVWCARTVSPECAVGAAVNKDGGGVLKFVGCCEAVP